MNAAATVALDTHCEHHGGRG